MLTYSMNSTMEQLLSNGFVHLEFRCKDCKNTRSRSLSEMESFLTLKHIQAGSACGSCGQATQYLKPLQKQHIAGLAILSTPPPNGIHTRRNSDPQANPIDKSIVSEISEAYNAYVKNIAQKNILEKFLLSGRHWHELDQSEQNFLLHQEKKRIKTAHLKTGGRIFLPMLTGLPIMF